MKSGDDRCQENRERASAPATALDSTALASTAHGRRDEPEPPAPDDAGAHHELGLALYGQGRHQEAEASFRRALQCDPRFSRAHNNLGALLVESGRLTEALECFRCSLEIDPDAAGAHNNLGCVLRDLGRLKEAEASFRGALERDPGYFQAWINLGLALSDQEKLEESQGSLRRAIGIDPDSGYAQHCLGSLLERAGGCDDEAEACLERAIALDPGSVDAYHTLGNLLLRRGESARSRELFRRAQLLSPLVSWPARDGRPEFSVLILDTPGPGCTPANYLADRTAFESHFYCVLPGVAPDIEMLRARADVVLNLIADADSGREILPWARDLVERLGRPTANHPELIMGTGREEIARLLAGIPLCRIPVTLRVAAGTEPARAPAAPPYGLALPLLARGAGLHGGDDLEKFDDLPSLAEFLRGHTETDCYLTEYVDYRSDDGFFRKYRFICVDGELFPYHLAIHDDWKVHHFRTDMTNQPWMRREEESFLQDTGLVFDEPHQAALRAMAAATGLQYCGIDCALHRDGAIVLFEANAAMLVHDEQDAVYAYKNRYVARIKSAFEAMLRRLAAGG